MEDLFSQQWAQDAGEMAIISYFGTWSSDTKKIALSIAQLVEDAIPNQDIVWGPALHRPLLGIGTDALVFVTCDRNSGVLTLVIRGTNPFELSQWLIQDFLVGELVPWSKLLSETRPWFERLFNLIRKKTSRDGVRARSGNEETPAVSLSAAIALKLHLAIKPAAGLPGYGRSLGSFLRKQARRGSELIFCGHSLGGLLAGIMGLWFTERGGSAPRIISFGAPCGGNDGFATLTEKQISRIYRVVNPFDIAPRVWNHENMLGLMEIYPDVEPGIALKISWEVMLELVEKKNYRQTLNPINTAAVLFKPRHYLIQAIMQHVLPYMALLQHRRSERCLESVILHLVRHAPLEDLDEMLIRQGWRDVSQSPLSN